VKSHTAAKTPQDKTVRQIRLQAISEKVTCSLFQAGEGRQETFYLDLMEEGQLSTMQSAFTAIVLECSSQLFP